MLNIEISLTKLIVKLYEVFAKKEKAEIRDALDAVIKFLDEYNDYIVSHLQVSKERLEALKLTIETDVSPENLKPMIMDIIHLAEKILEILT